MKLVTTQDKLDYYLSIGKAVKVRLDLNEKSRFKPTVIILGTKTVSGNYRGFCNIGGATIAEQRYFIKEIVPNFPGADIKPVDSMKEAEKVIEDCELSLSYINMDHFPKHIVSVFEK